MPGIMGRWFRWRSIRWRSSGLASGEGPHLCSSSYVAQRSSGACYWFGKGDRACHCASLCCRGGGGVFVCALGGGADFGCGGDWEGRDRGVCGGGPDQGRGLCAGGGGGAREIREDRYPGE